MMCSEVIRLRRLGVVMVRKEGGASEGFVPSVNSLGSRGKNQMRMTIYSSHVESLRTSP
jgi:hypothetical protein